MSKNGKVSPTPKLPNITKAAKPKIAEGPGENMPEMRGMKRTGQIVNGSHSGSPAPDTAKQTNAAHSGAHSAAHGENTPKGSHVPTGGHHQANHRAPSTHAEFHKLGHDPKKLY